jgi:Restriction endonuclease
MVKAGSAYEHEAAEFFRTFGLTAEVQKTVKGVRGENDIDVWVTGTMGAFQVQWVVECKDWKDNVPKEKVEALYAIVQNVGADRGWLLSEKGFQAGAVDWAEKTNITLTSLEVLREKTKAYIFETAINTLLFRIEKFQWDLDDAIHKKRQKADPEKGYWAPPDVCYDSMGRLSNFERALKRGLHDDYPILCDVVVRDGKEIPYVAKSPDELINIMAAIVRGYPRILENALRQLEDDPL